MAFDATNPADLAALQTEILTDPLGLGYDLNANLNELVALINAKNYTVSKPKISSADIRAAVTYVAYNNLSIDEQEWLVWMTGSNGYEEENVRVTPDLRDQLTVSSTFWAVGDRNAMQAAMLALIDVPGSRAEVLFGYATYIGITDIAAARDYQG
jgi:hypothetical protein